MTNVAIPPSGTGDAGKSVATETIGGVEYQLVKIITGTAASTTPVTPLTDTALRATPVPVSGTVTVDTSALSTSVLQTSGNVLAGAVNETAPATDTANSGLNGRLQRIAQRLTSLIAVFTIGAGTEAAAVRVTLPTDGTGKVNAAQSGTWNVTNVSGTVSLPTGAATAAKQPALGTAGSASTDVITVQGIASGTAQPISGTVTADTELNAAAALADAASASVSTATVGSVGLVMNATTLDRQRAVVNGMDSTGTGIASAGLVAQLDDTSTGTVTENQFSTVRMSPRRALLIEGDGPTTATTAGTQVASSATSVTLLSSNANRRGFIFYNGSTSSANVLFGTTASATSFSVFMAPGASYEQFGVNVYSGRIDAIWATANGNMQVTEW